MAGTAANDTRAPYSNCSVSSSPVYAGECRNDFKLNN